MFVGRANYPASSHKIGNQPALAAGLPAVKRAGGVKGTLPSGATWRVLGRQPASAAVQSAFISSLPRT